jgi:hypothetical protein
MRNVRKPSRGRALLRVALTTALVAACASEEAYDEAWGSDEIPAGKADGLLDSAEKLDFNEVGTGYVEGEQMDVYAIDLRGGDKITATMTVTSGDLNPHFTLYYGGSSYIGSATFVRQTRKIVKTYTLEATGRYYVAVKAYHQQGKGKYTFQITCNGGPCNGEPVTLELSDAEQGECIEKARVCSFAALPPYNGYVGPARSRSIFDTCLATAVTTDRGATCDSACAADKGQYICEDIISSLPFYADASAACLAELEECMTECARYAEGDAYDVGDTAIAMCWTNGLNNTCDSYARGHQDCGGVYADNSAEECLQLCEATTGAWVDDLDTMCSETCD